MVIDSDTPTLPTAYLAQALGFFADRETDVVLGPTDDGGYFLIGLRQSCPALFENMPWSTAEVRPETLRHAPVAPAAPTCLYLEVTNECNLTCKTCPLTYGRVESPALLSLEKVRFLAAQFPSATRIVLHGIGEPLLNKELPEIIRYLKGLERYVLFNSNATLLNNRWHQALIDSGLDEYRVSLDATTPESYARVRGKPMFPLILTNLQHFIALKQQRSAAHPRVSLWLTGLKDTLAELPDFLRLTPRLGIKEVYLQRLVYWQDDNPEKLATPGQSLFQNLRDEEEAIIQASEALARRLGLRFEASGSTTPERSIHQTADTQPWARCMRP
jgi:MoaA/NifB/PqqE/SkfB family radical SAM enzyme